MSVGMAFWIGTAFGALLVAPLYRAIRHERVFWGHLWGRGRRKW